MSYLNLDFYKFLCSVRTKSRLLEVAAIAFLF